MIKSKGRESWPSQRPWMKIVKELSHRKDRRTSKQLLHHECYEDIPKNQPADTEDSWGWD